MAGILLIQDFTMPSPFPGMNPWLEQEGAWHKFHEHFCTRCMEFLVPQVRPKYIVQLDENVYVHELPAEERRLLDRPDVYVAHDKPQSPQSRSRAPASALAAPAQVQLPLASVDIERLSFIAIRDRADRELVTVIELLSPSNKDSDRQQYLTKRHQYLSGGVRLVEIDLLRGGNRLPLEGLPPCDYYVMVARPEDAPKAGVWPIQLRDRLPRIPIPLRSPDRDIETDLQEMLNGVYDAGGYEDHIYAGQPSPPLSAEDEAWARPYIPRV